MNTIASATPSVLRDPLAWEADRSIRYELGTLNQAFHDAVPVLETTQWRIVRVERGFTETVLPLNVASTNQFVTHQAALMAVAADYTGGIALSTLFHGIPILGFHALTDDRAAYLWGAKASVKWMLPSTDDLICRATVAPDVWERAYGRFVAGRKVLETVRIEMFNAETKVAEADFTYWVADTRVLRASADSAQRIHPLQRHRLRSSAHLIAGLRVLEGDKDKPEQLFADRFAEVAAGKQGRTMARRFCVRTPELQPMVAARTRHLDDLVRLFERRGTAYQAINIGAGLDFRRWRLDLKHCSRYVEIDLPSMLLDKWRLASSLDGDIDQFDRVAADLLKEGVDAALMRLPAFDPTLPTICWWEGGSMYFSRERCLEILRSVLPLLAHQDSRLWFDYVSSDLIAGTTRMAHASTFLDAMQKMGEPFIHGFNEIADEVNELGFCLCDDIGSGQIVESPDQIYDLYRFCVVHAGLRQSRWQAAERVSTGTGH